MVILTGKIKDYRVEKDSNDIEYAYFHIENVRSSGIIDSVPCRMKCMYFGSLGNDMNVKVTGDLRTYKYEFGEITHSVSELWVKTVELVTEEYPSMNLVDTRATINYIGELRETPRGRKVLDVGLVVTRKNTDAKDRIHTVFWSSGADAFKKYMVLGKEIVVHGRLQTRTYTKQGFDTPFEVVEVSVSSWDSE